MADGPRRLWERTGILASLRHTSLRPGVELMAGLTLLAIALPEQLATARLAGMPPVTGLYAFVAGTVGFALLGCNPQLSVGADSTIAPLFAVALAHYAPAQSAPYAALAGLLAVTVGVIVALVGLLRLGWVAEFLSTPIITGFLAGVAVIIVVHQLPDVLSLPAASGSTLHRLGSVFSHLGATNGWSLGIAIAALALSLGVERVDRRLPAPLVALVGSTIVVAAFHLDAHGVAVLGNVAHGAPSFGLHRLGWTSFRQVLPVAGVVALVVVSQTAATSRAFSGLGDDDHPVDVGRDFLGVGAGSVIAGVSGGFPVNASPPRTAVVAGAGGRSQLVGLGAAGAVVLLVPAIGLLRHLPVATLGAILVLVALRIFRLRALATMARFDLFELGLAVVTLLTVALVGVEQGIAVAVGLAILDRTRLSARPKVHRMGRIPGTTSWEPLYGADHPAEVPGVVVLLFATPLYYANAEHFRTQVETALHDAPTTGALVLDAVGMHDIDFTASQVLAQILDELAHRHIAFGLARSGDHLRDNLERSGLDARIGADHFYPSVDEAVNALAPAS